MSGTDVKARKSKVAQRSNRMKKMKRKKKKAPIHSRTRKNGKAVVRKMRTLMLPRMT